MPMAVVVTRDVEARYRGFLASIMLEIAPGVYVHPRMSARVRNRVWDVIYEWHTELGQGGLLMTWADTAANGGMGLLIAGEQRKNIVAHDAMLLVRRELTEKENGMSYILKK